MQARATLKTATGGAAAATQVGRVFANSAVPYKLYNATVAGEPVILKVFKASAPTGLSKEEALIHELVGPHENLEGCSGVVMHLNVSAGSCGACDGSKGSFRPDGQLERAGEEWIRYGTQHDVVKKVVEKVRFHPDGPTLEAKFYVTVERAFAESNYNVMGLLRGESCFIDQIVPASHALHIRFREKRGFIGAIDKRVVPHIIQRAVVDAPLLQTVTGFYVVRLTGIRVGGVAVPNVPKYMLLDTGSNFSSFPSPVLARMLPGLQRNETLEIEIAGQPLTIGPKHYKWPNSVDIMIDDDLTVLNNSSEYALLGAFLMQNLSFTFLSTSLVISRPDDDDDVLQL